jgi:iron complex outermembrane recepter protein
VGRVDVGYSRPLWTLNNAKQLEGKLGAGLSVLSERPLPYGQFARAFALLDLSAAVALAPVELGLEVFNLLDTEYSAVEYSFVSNWDPQNASSRLPARHSSAGSPRTFMATLELQL